MRPFLLAVVACSAVAVAHFLTPTNAADSGKPDPTAAAPVPQPQPPSATPLVVHEWGTFTSFSGSDGVPVGFTPNNTDLPSFVYFQSNPYSKSGRLNAGGLVSMETPVIYFYTDKETRASVKVDFPRGWITEWYPYAQSPPQLKLNDKGGQSIRWDVRLAPGEPDRFPIDKNDPKNHYYHARETDAVPLQSEVTRRDEREESDERRLRGGTVLQREKLLFYRGVGTFPPPVTVRALGGDKVRVVNGAGGRSSGLVLVTVRDGKIGFRPIGELDSGAETVAQLPEVNGGSRTDLAEFLVKELTAAGLYEKEARAMVKTWDAAWFGEEGSRLLYLVPRAKTDELLPITIDPKPTEVVRVLVGRHDFLTPEQEAVAEREVKRLRAAQAEIDAAYKQLAKLGRFTGEAQQQAAQRLDAKQQK